MTDKEKTLGDVLEETPELGSMAISEFVRGVANKDIEPTLENLFPGDESVVNQLKDRGWATFKNDSGQEQFVAVDADKDGNVFNVAAAIPRAPGRSETYLNAIEDFQDTTGLNHADKIGLFRRIYRAEGEPNNAINKMASLVATTGEFKVKSVSGKRGIKTDDRVQGFKTALNYWVTNVNSGPEGAVKTGNRGLAVFMAAGVRLCLQEGSHIGREVWSSIEVPNVGAFDIPMNLQSISAAQIEIPTGIEGMPLEIMYWKPPGSFISLLNSTRKEDKPVLDAINKLMDSEVLNALKKDRRYLLDPDLLFHIRNRQTGTENFGESVLECAMSDIRYKRALDALELVTIENLINRLVIIKVGDSDPKSAYHAPGSAKSRIGLLRRILQQAGPSAMVIWAGPDIDIVEVGAHNTILSLDGRYKIATNRIRAALGVPAALLVGEGTDGKAAGWAAAIGLAAQLQELQNQYQQWLISVAKKIGEQNGYEQVEVTWDYNNNLLVDKQAAAEIIMKLFQSGLLSIQTALSEVGFDYESERNRMVDEVAAGYRDEEFGPPKASMTTNPAGNDNGGGGDGRPTRDETGNPDPRNNRETKTTEENK